MTEKCTLKGATILDVDPTGCYGKISIPGVGVRRIHQSGVHEDSEIYWEQSRGKVKIESGPAKLVLNGWYAERIGLDLD